MVTKFAQVLGQKILKSDLHEVASIDTTETDLHKKLRELSELALPITAAPVGKGLSIWFQGSHGEPFVVEVACLGEPRGVWKALKEKWKPHAN